MARRVVREKLEEVDEYGAWWADAMLLKHSRGEA